MTDPRTPVIVGVSQLTRRPDTYPDVSAAAEPVDLMAEAVREAVDDAGAADLLTGIQATFVPQPLSRRYPDPGLLVNQRLGLDDARSFRSLVGGNSPQLLLNESCRMIARGDLDVAVITGAEAMYSRFRAKREGVALEWERSGVPPCPRQIGDTRDGATAHEAAHGASIPIEIYPLFETAVRAARGRDVAEHQEAVGDLWSRFSAVAAEHPNAWTRTAYTSDEIIKPGDDNRLVTFPYTKRMCANMAVDMAAAVVVCSVDAADRLGVADDRRVFPLAGADAHDHFHVSERWSLAESPAIGVLGRAVTAAVGADLDHVARFDLYSCFPSAVEVAMSALNLGSSDERPVTLTGGLPLFGGPGNNYVTHSIAATVDACRDDPGSLSMVTGVGWYLTKHSVGLYSTTPRAEGFVRVDPHTSQAHIDATPRRTPAGDHEGVAVIEATAVRSSRAGAPERATASLLTGDGRRTFAVTDDLDAMQSMVEEAWEGRQVHVQPDGGLNRLKPA